MSVFNNSRFRNIRSAAFNAAGFAWVAAALAWAVPAGAQTYPLTLMPTAQTEPQEWVFTFDQPAAGWGESAFDDANWKKGLSGFGTRGTPGAVIGTEWSTPDIWIRRTIDLKDMANKSGLSLLLHHDEDVEVFVNGIQVYAATGYSVRYEVDYLDLEGVKAFVEGTNTIAVHCHQTIGGQYLDLGLVEYVAGQSVDLIQNSFSGGSDWKYLTTDPNGDCTTLSFDDAAWLTGKGGFGAGGDMASQIHTDWTSSDIYLRGKFTVTAGQFAHYILNVAHDDEATVWINGKQVAMLSGYQTSAQALDISGPAKGAIVAGENVLVIQCHNAAGTPQYVDASLVGLPAEVPVALDAPSNRRVTASEARFFRWSPGHSRLLVGAHGRVSDLAGRAAPSAFPR